MLAINRSFPVCCLFVASVLAINRFFPVCRRFVTSVSVGCHSWPFFISCIFFFWTREGFCLFHWFSFDQLDPVLLTSFQSLGLLFFCFLTYLFEVQLQNYGFFFHYKYSNLWKTEEGFLSTRSMYWKGIWSSMEGMIKGYKGAIKHNLAAVKNSTNIETISKGFLGFIRSVY